MALLFKQLFPIRQVTKPLIPLRLSSFHTLFVALALWIDCPQTRDIKRFTKATHYSRKELRVSPPDSLPPPTQFDPAGHDYERPDESARTAQSHDYNTWQPTRIGRFTSDDAQPVYNERPQRLHIK